MVQKILDEEISGLKVSALPTRPTAPSSFGGRGYTATEMKAAFDKLPLYIVKRFNELIELINGQGSESISESIKTGINEKHTLKDLFDDIRNGNLSSYLDVYGRSLVEVLEDMISRVDSAKGDVEDAKASFAAALGELDAAMGEVDAVMSEVAKIKRDMGEDYTAPEFVILDCGNPSQRGKGGLPDAK